MWMLPNSSFLFFILWIFNLIYKVSVQYMWLWCRCKFPYYVWNVYSNRFRVEVNSQFLSPNVTYTIYIVFKYCGRSSPKYIPFEYKLDEETHYSRSCIAYAKEDNGWLVTKLYQFTSHHGAQHFKIDFLSRNQVPLDHAFGFEEEFAFEGIEFRPLEIVS